MMVRLLAVGLALCAATAYGQGMTAPPLKANATLILVPTEVRTRAGEVVYGLRADQFQIEDDGVVQTPHLDEPDMPQRLAVVVVVQCSRSADREAAHLKGLATMVEDLVGAAPHTVAVVSFGNDPDLVQDFSSDPAEVRESLSRVGPCSDEEENVTLDAVEYASDLLRKKTVADARKVILLVSETRDHGSAVDSSDVVAELGRSNVVVESVSYGPAKSQMVDELVHQHHQVIMNAQVNLVPLLVMAGEALRQNVPHTLAQLSGGQYINFTTAKGFDAGVHRLTNQLHNEYRLSFQPTFPVTPGIHHLSVTVPSMPDAVVRARLIYFSGRLSEVE